MKKIQLILFALILIIFIPIYAQVGFGTNSPNIAAKLDIASTNKGFIPPRMSLAQRDAIASPAVGLMIWCSNCCQNGEAQIYNGTSWTNIIGGVTCAATYVSICSQNWAPKNLDVDRYRNGDPIPQVTNFAAWAALTTGAYCYYDNDSATYASTYGKLYNWYALNDPRGLAPVGWHIPSDVEWSTLTNCLGGESIAGGPMKETGLTHWLAPNTGATNSSGFTGLPGGFRGLNGSFGNVGNFGYWWSSTEFNTSNAWLRYLSYNDGSINRYSNDKNYGFSVRCLRD